MKNYKFNITIIVIVSFFVFYLSLKDDFVNVINIIANINVFWVFLAILLILGNWFFRTQGFYLLTKKTIADCSYIEMLKTIVVTNFFNGITPFASGGQPFQIYYLKNRGISLLTATNLVIENSILYQIALVIFGAIAIIANYKFNIIPHDYLLKKLVIIGFVVSVAIIGLLFFISFGKKSNSFIIRKTISILYKLRIIKDKDLLMEKVNHYIDNFYLGASIFKHDKPLLIKGIIYNLLSLLCLFAIPLFVAYSVGEFNNLTLAQTLVSSVFLMLIAGYVPIPGGTGGFEVGFVHFFGYFITGPVLMATLLIWRLLTYYLGIFTGGILLIMTKDKKEGI